MHACKLHSPSIKQLSESLLHNIMSSHISASALLSQPAAAFRDSDGEIGGNGLVVATVEHEARGPERIPFHLNVRSSTQNVGRRTCLPYEYV